MELAPDRLAGHLAQGLAPLYVLWGEEPLGLLEAENAIRAAARRAGYIERQVYDVQGRYNWEAVTKDGGNLSLFGARRLAEIRIPSGKPGTDGSRALADYAAHLPGDTLTLISLPNLEWRATQSKWFGALAAAGVTLQFRAVESARLPAWIAGRLKAQGFDAPTEVLDWLAQRVEGNLLAARQEIDKLALLLPAGRLDLAAVQAAVTDVARYDVDQLPDALYQADLARYSRILAHLREEGEALPRILWQLSSALRLLLRLQSGLQRGETLPRLLAAQRVWEKRRPLVEGALRRLTLPRLEQSLMRLALLDRQAKGLEPGDLWSELQRLGLYLCRAPRRQAATE